MRVAIVVAGGTGERFGRAGGKQLAPVAGAPVVTHALRAFEDSETIDDVVLVCHPDSVDEFLRTAVLGQGVGKVSSVIAGGTSRRLSVAAGLAALPKGTLVVAVHDGARPLVEAGVIDAAVRDLESSPGIDGVVVGHPAYDTIKAVGGSLEVDGTPDRAGLWVAQTPQVFRADSLIGAHARAEADGWEGTDDASLVERAGGVVRMIEGPRWNIKVTVEQDLLVVEALLTHRGGEGG